MNDSNVKHRTVVNVLVFSLDWLNIVKSFNAYLIYINYLAQDEMRNRYNHVSPW